MRKMESGGKMKLGIAYNVFDGEELLEGSIAQIRHVADYIVAIVQTTSNHGNQYTGGYEECLRLADMGLLDEVVVVQPKSGAAWQKEREKRSLGLVYCLRNGCTHFVSMDCDEYYDGDLFENAFNRFRKSSFDASACRLRTYYKLPTLRLYPNEDYWVPLFHKVDANSRFIDKYPVYCDPTRRISCTNFLSFQRDEIEMHHFSFVRSNIRRKLDNSSAKRNFEKDIDAHVEQWFKAKAGDTINYFGEGKRLVEVENIFKIEL